ncbi:hypothetical protein Phep_3435 [Pedobacter heparinus DSM 2366]|uniref:Uncharacterized protein n=2 Tax=Pedobacter heparinus TaxID=984 RepID=C6XSR5_PEDHD|nr:hypothetical protein Phep_3435 [Pedobacter heparinus DSM 2366]
MKLFMRPGKSNKAFCHIYNNLLTIYPMNSDGTQFTGKAGTFLMAANGTVQNSLRYTLLKEKSFTGLGFIVCNIDICVRLL